MHPRPLRQFCQGIEGETPQIQPQTAHGSLIAHGPRVAVGRLEVKKNANEPLEIVGKITPMHFLSLGLFWLFVLCCGFFLFQTLTEQQHPLARIPPSGSSVPFICLFPHPSHPPESTLQMGTYLPWLETEPNLCTG